MLAVNLLELRYNEHKRPDQMIALFYLTSITKNKIILKIKKLNI